MDSCPASHSWHVGTAASSNDRIVLIGGWGMNVAVLSPLASALGASMTLDPLTAFATSRDAQLESWRAWLQARLPERAVLVGWSLGGTIATDFAAHYPERVAALVTLCTNPCFRARDDWPLGMSTKDLDDFAMTLRSEPASLLERFSSLLALGDIYGRAIRRELRRNLARVQDAPMLGAALDALAHLDLRATLGTLTTPTLHILGENDSLVPGRIASEYSHLQPDASVWVAAGAGHAPFLSRPEAVAARVLDFLEPRAHRHEVGPRSTVARSFSHAAPDYDNAAHIQRASGDALLARAPLNFTPARVLDLGCGTGAQLPALAQSFVGAELLAADIAEGMLRVARGRGAACALLAADGVALPLAAASIDLVYSNFALQWIDPLEAALAELARILRPGGCALVSTIGPDTLWELRAAWRMVDDETHVHRFYRPQHLCEIAQAAGLRIDRLDTERHVERHASVLAVARGLHDIGAHTLHPRRRSGLVGKALWRRVAEAYATLADGEDALPATWQIVYLVLSKPHA